ncbi:DUF4974 domain-containing protein [Chitinophaga sp. SYP-B3965]|uniref:FecR family protein n=1 Tax=Chitinophaga sp. SYP-B3965 TaxID=2663120 RepID=UPI00129A044F|nr:DUF4974 domain-containing protein [Chitinophaga sp. SYP-B3965]
MDQKTILSLIEKYLDGTATPEERNILLDWYRQEADQPATWETSSAEDITRLKTRMLGQLQLHMRKTRRPVSMFSRWRLAAAVLVLAAGGLVMSLIFLPGKHNVPEQTWLTGKGERKKIRLPDSSLVWLAPCSELKYQERKVVLSGEAFFEVATNAEHPFIIHTQSLTTKVLGTAFNIHAYPEDTLITVTLLNGSVLLKEGEKEQRLMPMQKGFFGKRSGYLSYVDDPDAALMLQRREGEIEYNNVKLGIIIEDMQRLFNVTIAIEEEAKDCLFYGRLKANEDIETFLAKLSRVIGVKVDTKGHKYFILKGKC